MKTSIKKFCKKCMKCVSRCCGLLFLFIILSTQIVVAQPLGLKNIKDNLAKIKEAQKIQAHEEFMGYVYMVLGFGLVIAVAWFSTVKAKKMKEKNDEAKRKFLENKIANQGGKIVHRDPHRRGHRR